MEVPPVLFHSPLYRSFILVLGKLLYEYRPKSPGLKFYYDKTTVPSTFLLFDER